MQLISGIKISLLLHGLFHGFVIEIICPLPEISVEALRKMDIFQSISKDYYPTKINYEILGVSKRIPPFEYSWSTNNF